MKIIEGGVTAAKGFEAAATAAGTAGGTCAGRLDLRVRSERERKLLPELRSEEAGAEARGRRMEVQLRRDGKRKVLSGVRRAPPPGML